MKIAVRVLGDLLPYIGGGLTLALEEGANIKTLSSLLSEKVKSRDTGYLGFYVLQWRDLVILVNGRNVEHLEGEETVLRDGDVITLLTPIEGG